MPLSILATKLFPPPLRASLVPRPHLIARLDAGLAAGHRLSLISAPAGFGKTTLVASWLSERMKDEDRKTGQSDPSSFILHPSSFAWLSLDAGDSDPARFLAYLVAALQTAAAPVGAGLVDLLQSPQLPPVEALLTTLLNDLAALPDRVVLALDDYHALDAPAVDQALTFLVEHLPPQLHLVIVTREDPRLPLARLRARDQLTELRASDLRFTPAEAATFLTQVMGLTLSADEIAALEARTEGWVAGLQLAALSMQGRDDIAGFIQAFAGSHRFVLDYLIEEVLGLQPESIQTFLLRTSILDRLCGPLCDAVLLDSAASGQETLERLEHTNLFIVPLDDERRWYRYHHLFGELLRQRLGQSLASGEVAALHSRASAWCEQSGLLFEAFRHAVAANDVARAARLIERREMGLHIRSVAMPVLDWLAALPEAVLDAMPELRVRSATLALMTGQTSGVEEKLQAAERVLHGVEHDEQVADLLGQVACARATLALTRYDPDTMIAQAQRALEHLRPDNVSFRFTASWALSTALRFKGDRAGAARACQESIALSERSGDAFSQILAIRILGDLQELDGQLHQAAATYQRMLELSGEHPQPNAGEAHLGLARIFYEWNDLEAAEQHGQQSLRLTGLYDRVIDRFILSEVFLARLRLARGDVDTAAAMLAQTEQTARQRGFTLRLPEIAAAQVLVLLHKGRLDVADKLAQQDELPLSQARVLLAQGDPSAALALLAPFCRQMEDRGWADERLRAIVLQALALNLKGDNDTALHVLAEALALAEPEGFIRTFVDEGPPMAELLGRMRVEGGRMQEYLHTLLAAFGHEHERQHSALSPQPLPEPLSQRELEVLQLIAQGLSNQEIAARLFLALDTVKGHTRRIYDKLQAQRRTEAVARARDLGLL
ncbi:MAG: LuxR family transcriptional regulator [Chloroflexales bacterium]|nr:LuxR family transcriptional regulator [Chloroflexales bacterium]